jgi:predicted 3-demethylubiquinone-9 3-methyltransferase (glyoxalase superfamily)
MQNISPCLWLDGNLEEAVNFYTSIFKNSLIKNVTRYGDNAPFPSGSIMTATFQLDGVEFMGINGGPEFNFTAAISFFVKCETQEQIDDLWEKLSTGGEAQRCGWLKDRFGISWQVVPTLLGNYLQDKDAEKAKRVMDTMLRMEKIIISDLIAAYEGMI